MSSEPCPGGFEAPHFSECFSPFRYCSIKGCGRSERDDEPAAMSSESTPGAALDRLRMVLRNQLRDGRDALTAVASCRTAEDADGCQAIAARARLGGWEAATAEAIIGLAAVLPALADELQRENDWQLDVMRNRDCGDWSGAIAHLRSLAAPADDQEPGLILCHHCGSMGPAGQDHICTCPFRDSDCLDHPNPGGIDNDG
jgi:hypothetical protein